jgi:hypothetical protein
MVRRPKNEFAVAVGGRVIDDEVSAEGHFMVPYRPRVSWYSRSLIRSTST